MLDIPNMPARSLPRLLVFEGTHGPGTLGLELLLQGEDGDFLSDIISRLPVAADSFQVLIEVSDLESTTHGFHRFTRITGVEVQPLDIDKSTYKSANGEAVRRLDALDE
jgi:hypothetical protein